MPETRTDLSKDTRAHCSAEQRRRQILAAAMKVFAVGGYARTTMDRIATEAKVAKGSLYNYFPSKQALFMALFVDSIASVERQTEELVTAEMSAADKIGALVDLWFEDFEFFCSVGGLVLEFWASAAREDRAGRMTESLRKVYQVNRDRVAAIVSQGMADGSFRPGDTVAAATSIMALLDGLMLQSILNVGVTVNAEFLDALKRRIFEALVGGGNLNPAARPAD